jgi:hypothetical protein
MCGSHFLLNSKLHFVLFSTMLQQGLHTMSSPLPMHCDITQRGYILTLNMQFLTIDGTLQWIGTYTGTFFQFSGHEPIYFIENKEKTLRASYDRDTQIVDYMN